MDDTGNLGKVSIAYVDRDTSGIIDSGATDCMPYNKSLFQYMTTLPKEHVVTTNGDVVPVTGTDSIALTLTLSLHRTLLIPALLDHLSSVG